MTRGKLNATDIIKPIFIASLDNDGDKLIRIFPENAQNFRNDSKVGLYAYLRTLHLY